MGVSAKVMVSWNTVKWDSLVVVIPECFNTGDSDAIGWRRLWGEIEGWPLDSNGLRVDDVGIFFLESWFLCRRSPKVYLGRKWRAAGDDNSRGAQQDGYRKGWSVALEQDCVEVQTYTFQTCQNGSKLEWNELYSVQLYSAPSLSMLRSCTWTYCRMCVGDCVRSDAASVVAVREHNALSYVAWMIDSTCL